MPNYFEFPKGSEWRKWDLHLHAPSSALNNNFIGSTTEEKWNKYIDKLESLSDIAVLGITDYFSVDGYFKVRDYKNAGRLGNISLILPNVELRILPVTTTVTPINIHLIFSPNIADDLEVKFFSKLEYEYSEEPYSCTKDGLIALGRKYKNDPTLAEQSAYCVGVEQFKTTIGIVKELINKSKQLKDNVIIVVSNSNRDGNSGIQHSSLATTRQEIYRFADCIFSGNPNDREYFIGKRTDSKEDIIKKIGNLKPCIHGSDAHDLDSICKPDQNRYTWIKANPTFEGFRQILYEPETRVKIQETKPDQKPSYQVIDKVRFIDSSTDLLFPSSYIELNNNLNVIVGGKSSGKSLLLYHIAKTLSPKQVESKYGVSLQKKYEFEERPDFDFEVCWADDTRYTLTQDESEKKRPITYIPQMYINHLAEEKGKDQLNNMILDIITSQENINTFYQHKLSQIGNAKLGIAGKIVEFFSLFDKYKAKYDEVRTFGDKEGIKKEIDNVEKELESIQKTSILNGEETSRYNELIRQKNQLQKENVKYKNLYSKLEEIQYKIEHIINRDISEINNLKNNHLTFFGNESYSIEMVTNIYKKICDRFILIKNDIINVDLINIIELKEKISSVLAQTENNENLLKPFESKFRNRDLLLQKQNSIKEYNDILTKIDLWEREITDLKISLEKCREDLINGYSQILEAYLDIKSEFNKDENKQITNEIETNTEIIFDHKKFEREFIELFDRRAKFSKSLDYFNEDNFIDFDPHIHVQKILKLFNILVENKDNNIRIKDSEKIKDAISVLLSDLFSLEIEIVHNNEKLFVMSPGKRGLVLLQLLLQFSDAKHPFLIDQPEDNLDNRTIFKELTEFIKRKKLQRQIILVTHNPNLVVSADAEEVIVANQKGQLNDRENSQYNFEYVSGPLECVFKAPTERGILYQKGIRHHVCEVLEGGEDAFKKREKKYRIGGIEE